ncbi:hypothetical protein [Neobacillus massiliamazoniensis]|uniref:Uncharacterized protein n=1 Tax=Neobacillus massiliamazoniensis TaxID=1499688 RepID=A0A0U1P0Y9_9BACI|nr:hypothetical protein [Neobacillus massiliamazoniensis]CRK83742.1 hypothetical protein BN000_03733 [Neobacillus massiliamazoniensis]
MFQVLIDHTDINALIALYVSINIGITLKYLWTRSVEYSFMGDISNPENTKITHPLFLYEKKSHLNGSLILNRIVKHIRKKECPKNDSEEPFPSWLSNISIKNI